MKDPGGKSHHKSDLRLLITVISTEDGGGGAEGGLLAIEGTAGNSRSSNKQQLKVTCFG